MDRAISGTKGPLTSCHCAQQPYYLMSCFTFTLNCLRFSQFVFDPLLFFFCTTTYVELVRLCRLWECTICTEIGIAVEIWSIRPVHLLLCVFGFSQRDGPQESDCQRNLLPCRQNTRDHADCPSCWVCVLSRTFPFVQAMLKIIPRTEMERKRCSHCIC